MMKKTLFSVLLISSISLAVAQDAVKKKKTSPVELNQTSEYDIIDNKPITIKGEAIIVKEGNAVKSEQPAAEKKQAKAVNKPTPAKGTTEDKK